MATISITSLGLGNADLTAIGKLSETGLSQTEIADAVVEGDKLKKGNKLVAYDGHLINTSNPHNTTAGQVGAYTKAEVDGFVGAKLDKNTAIVGTTKTKITYDAKGLVTGGVDLVEADLPNISQAKITNLVSDLSNKQSRLISGTTIKTINGQSVLGSGDIVITGGGSGGEVDLTNYYTKSETYNKVETNSLVATKQDTLVSGTSIKTINGQSVLGNGNIFITAETDLTNYYTKPQVDEFINEINAELGSMVILGEYGVRWNQETDVYEALGSVNRRQIQGNMKRCVLKDDGTVNYYLNPTNSTQKAQGGTAVLTGADGNVMVEVPKFWYKHTLVGDTHEWWVSNTPLEGYSVHPWFLEGGVEKPFRYYRAYTCTNVGGKLRSISGSTPTRNQTRATFRTQARANGTGWELCSWNAVNAIQILFLTEYCTFNSQAVLGTGNDTGGDFGITTGQSNSIGNTSSGASNNNMWMSYRGIENWYADCYEFIDGTNVQNYKVYLNQNPATFADDVFTGDYVDSGITVPAMLGSYTKKISGNFLPTADGGSSSTYITDVGWSATGDRVVSFGGTASNGLSCGAFCWNAYTTVSSSNEYIGSGLSR